MYGLAHIILAVGLTLMSWRALSQPWLGDVTPDPIVALTVRLVLPFTALAGSVLWLAAGRIGGDQRGAMQRDAMSAGAIFVAMFLLALGGAPRDTIGLIVVVTVVARFAPIAWWTMRYGAPPIFVFALCLAFYAPLAGWRAAASLPFGDQVFYLLSAEKLAHGSLDAMIDPARFQELLGVPPGAIDAATHIADSPVGPRLVQGYALPALLAPAWVIGGQVGATLVITLFAAWTATQTWLLLGETISDRLAARLAWALSALCGPLALAAVHVYPNAVGAAIVVTGYRLAFTARHRQPALAGALLGATAFLNPRDGLVLVALVPFALAWPRDQLVRFALSAAALIAAAAVVSFATFGLPVPYAGYLLGTGTAQTIQSEPTWTFRFWIGLPAILFDRVFGIAGTAPWLLLAALGAAPALRRDRSRLLPGAAAVGASIVALSMFRLWEGGYAPPNRYVVDVLPLAAPFVAVGFAAVHTLPLRAVATTLVGTSALMTTFLLAVPSAALNSAFEDKPQALLATAVGLDPLGWLPSFQPVTPDWWIAAYLRLIPALAIVTLLALTGWRRART